MKLFDNLRFFVRLVLLALLSWALLSCNTLKQQAKFYQKNPHLIPTVNERISQTFTTKADTLSSSATLDISKPTGVDGRAYPLAKLYTFENKRSKTTIAIDVANITTDSLPLEVQTIVKPDTITQDTTISYQQYQFSPPKPTSWQRWNRWLCFFTIVLAWLCIKVFVAVIRK